MASIADIVARLKIDTSSVSTSLRSASASLKSFSAQAQKTMKATMVDPIKESKFQFKDVSRIVQGIMLSQVFYAGVRAIREAISAVYDFGNSLEYAQMVYSNLFNSTELAEEFINVLQDFAAVTPYAFTDAEATAKRLLAYGIQSQNVMYVLQGVMAAATVQGNSSVIEPISRALGQIYTKGRVMGEELRQLAEAGIPVYEILQEKLGLTADQIANIGDMAIPASTAINALVDGINERFGSTLDEASTTTTGIISNIKDNALQLFAGMAEPFHDSIKEVVSAIGETLVELREAFESGGFGGLFEAIIPEELRDEVKMLIMNFGTLWKTLKEGLSVGLNVLKQMILPIMRALNVLLPIINAVSTAIVKVAGFLVEHTKIVQVITTLILAAAGAWAVYKTQMLIAATVSTLVKGMAVLIEGLGVALAWVAANPVWAVFAVGIGLLISLTGATDMFRNALTSLYGTVMSMMGIDYDNFLMPETADRTADISKFNEALSETSDQMSDLADSTGDAASAAKSLLSFDEVFRLDSPDETGSESIDISTPDLPDLSDYDYSIPSITTPEVDMTDYADSIWDALYSALDGKNFGELIHSLFWGPIKEAFNLSDSQTFATEITTSLGAILGGLGGFIIKFLGAASWADVKLAFGLIVREFMEGGFKAGLSGIGKVFKVAVEDVGIWNAVKNGIKGGLKGAIVGAIVDLVAGALAAQWAQKIREVFKFDESVLDSAGWGQTIGGILGGIIGTILGGPLGGIIGIALGDLVGSVLGTFWDRTYEELKAIPAGWWQMLVDGWDFNDGDSLATNIFEWLKASFSLAFSWILVPLQLLWTGLLKPLMDGIGALFGVDVTGSISEFFGNFGENIQNFRDNQGASFIAWCEEAGGSIKTWLSDAWTNLSTWFTQTLEGFTGWTGSVGAGIGTWSVTTMTTVVTWLTNTLAGFTTWWSNVTTGFTTFFTNVFTNITTFLSNAWSNITTWCTNVYNNFTTWFANNSAGFSTFFSTILTNLLTWLSGLLGSIGEFISNSFTSLSGWWNSVISGFATFVGNVLGTVSGLASNAYGVFANMVNSIYSILSGWWSNVITGFSSFGSNVYSTITGWINKAISSVQSLVDKAKSAVASLKSVFSSVGSTTSKVTSAVKLGYTTLSAGHATGGVFNREHIASFAEGNKAEAIIPLENKTAMQPFVDAVANGLTATLAPLMATTNGTTDSSQIMYVGTLIADDQGLKELNRKMQVIQLAESARRS